MRNLKYFERPLIGEAYTEVSDEYAHFCGSLPFSNEKEEEVLITVGELVQELSRICGA